MKLNEKKFIMASRGNNNNDYKKELYNLISVLPGEFMLLKKGALGKVLDVLWKLSSGNRTIYIFIRTKTNKSIQTFDERKIKQSIDNTLKLIKKEKNINCFFWFVGGDHLPNKSSHGGFRENQLQQSFQQKLFKIQIYLQSSQIVRTAHANAFTNKSFLSLIHDLGYGSKDVSVDKILDSLTTGEKFNKPLGIFLNKEDAN